jgi:hypothetical protein
MRPPELPSRAEVEALVRQQYEERDVAKACANCSHWIREYSFCPILNKTSPAFMHCNQHESEVSHIVNVTMRNMLEDATECKKIQYLQSAGYAYADMTMKVLADMERRVDKQREASNDSRERNLLKRDLTMCENFEKAYGVIKEKIREIEQQYEWYIMPYFNLAFTDGGKYNETDSDLFNSDTGEFIINNLEYQRCCYKNEENAQKINEFMSNLKNDQYFPLDNDDINHYSVKI